MIYLVVVRPGCLYLLMYERNYDLIYINLATVVEGNPKAPFSIATTLRCRGGLNSLPWIAPLYPYNAKVSRTIFLVFGLELQSSGSLANTLISDHGVGRISTIVNLLNCEFVFSE